MLSAALFIITTARCVPIAESLLLLLSKAGQRQLAAFYMAGRRVSLD